MAVFQFQAADADMGRWKADAAREKVSFAAYIRSLLDANGPVHQRVATGEPTLQPLEPPKYVDPRPQAPSGKRSFAPDPK